MADACTAFQPANSSFENLLLDLVARHYLFRALVLGGFEFNKTQVFALFPPSVSFLSNISTRSRYYVRSLQQSSRFARPFLPPPGGFDPLLSGPLN
jgi:hypothetical protein